jgi:Flp pilus assembly protein TadG
VRREFLDQSTALTRRIARFRHDATGHVAMMFAACLVPLLGCVGTAVDYSLASSKRTKIQSALDQAMLAGAIAGKQTLDGGSGKNAAIDAANAAAATFFAANTPGITASLTTDYKMNGLNLSGTGSASANSPTTFMKIAGFSDIPISTTSQATSATQPFLNVYLLVDISASMLLPSTESGIKQMIAGQGCALACHDKTNGTDSYGWAIKNGIEFRYQVVNQGINNLLTYLGDNANLKSHVKIGLWSFDHKLTEMTSVTASYKNVAKNFPAPALAETDASAATPFDNLIDDFVSIVGKAGDGSSSGSPQKMVIIATDGVNDPTRGWVSNASLRSEVRVFDTEFCSTFQKNGVVVAIINTPYYPMTWDWGYNATLGQPGSFGGATRVDDIPIALKKCAGKYFTIASDTASIQSAFTNLFVAASPIRLTK